MYGFHCVVAHAIFSMFQTRKSAEWLAGEMCKHGHSVALITGDSTTEQRIAVLDRLVQNSYG